MSDTNPSMFRITGPKVLLALVAFFGIVAAVDGVMIYQAVSTFGGLDEADPYRKGLKYNDRIATFTAQEKRGWKDSIALDAGGEKLIVTIIDRDGGAIAGLTVNAKIERPATNVFDRKLVLADQGDGRYLVSVPGLQAGTWTVAVEARADKSLDADIVYQSKARVWKKS